MSDKCEKKPHKWGKWHVTRDTVNDQAFEQRRCKRCGKSEYRKIPFID